jgi:hypothetical protein
MAWAAIANGDTVVLSGPAGVGGGGVFNATATLQVGGTETFKTFCVERNETIGFGVGYTASVNNGAVLGGESGQDPVGSKYDPLSNATKWFYGQYSEIIKGINPSNTLAHESGFNANSTDWTNALQLVIWRLEGEVSVDGPGNWNDLNNSEPMSVSSSSTMAMDAAKLWHDFVDSGIANAGDFHVKVLNLWTHPLSSFDYQYLDSLDMNGTTARNDATANKAQSQLYYDSDIQNGGLPAPEPTAILIWGSMVGFGLALNRFRSRNKSRA